jgi:hypothetical protein
MFPRIYRFPIKSSRPRARNELAAAIRDITPAVKTIAEELKRGSVIGAARFLARNERFEPSSDRSRR